MTMDLIRGKKLVAGAVRLHAADIDTLEDTGSDFNSDGAVDVYFRDAKGTRSSRRKRRRLVSEQEDLVTRRIVLEATA